MPTGSRIKEIRKQKGLTQKQLGDLCGMADSAIRRYENGNANPKIETLHKIADALGCTMHELLNGDDTFKAITNTTIFENADGSRYEKTETTIELTDRAKFIDCYDNMNKIGQREALKRVSEMTELEKYTRKRDKLKLETVSDEKLKQDYKYYPPDTPELNAAHTRTDIDIPDNVDTSENDIMDDENF